MSSTLPNEKSIARRKLKLSDLPRPDKDNTILTIKVDQLRKAILEDSPDIIRAMATDEQFPEFLTCIYFRNTSRNAPIVEYLLQCGLSFDLLTAEAGAVKNLLDSAVDYECYTVITTMLEKHRFSNHDHDLSVKLLALIMKMPTCRHMMKLLGKVSQECLDKCLEISVSNLSGLATDRLLQYGAVPNIRCLGNALRYQPLRIWKLLKNIKFIRISKLDDLMSFIGALFESPLWNPKGTRAKKEINVYRLPHPSKEYKWMPSKERWLRYKRQERMRIVCRIKLDFVLLTGGSIGERIVDVYEGTITEDLIRECWHYAIHHNTNIMAALCLKQIGIPRDIRRIIIKMIYPLYISAENRK